MKRKRVFIALGVIVAVVMISGVLVVRMLQRWNEMFEAITDRNASKLLSNAELMDYLNSWNKDVVNNTLTVIEFKGDPFAVDKAKALLKSKDDYIWLGAASYLGACNERESVPYLIKALRHTAWRGDQRRANYLHAMTDQDFGTNFTEWKLWWEQSSHKTNFDWESSLGPKPRLHN